MPGDSGSGHSANTRRLGLDSQTLFGMPPVQHIELAASLGCGSVSLGPGPVPWKFERFAAWSLADDAKLRRETKAALRDTGLRLALGEGFTIRPETEALYRVATFDVMAELGAESISAVSMEPDAARARDQMAILAAQAAVRGMQFLFEFAPPHTFNTLAKAHAAVLSLGQPGAKLLIDAMHLFRAGGTVAELARIDPAMIGYAQLSDAPLKGGEGDYYREASFERLPPGAGELPLKELVAVLPGDIQLGIEVPMQATLLAVEDFRAPIARIVAAASALIAEAETAPAIGAD